MYMRSFSLFSLFILLVFPASQVLSKPAVIPLDKVIAVVDDTVITQLELDERAKLIRQQLQQQKSRLPSKEILHKQVLERLILEKLQLEMANKTGIRVNDEMVNRVIANIARENNLSMEQFQQVLKKDGYKFADFRENIRREVTISRLRKMRVENRIIISEQEVENFLNQQTKNKSAKDEYRLSHILIAIPEAATPDQIELARKKAQKITDELLKGANFTQKAIAVSSDELALKGGDLGWRKSAQLPTFLTEEVVKMAKNEIKGPIRSASGFHIIKLQDKRSNQRKHMVQQTMARHILIRPTQILSREEARIRLARIRERILEGDDFANLARANSDDKAAAAEGGSLGWVNPGMMVPRFEEEMNKLKPGDISEPFLTQFGWHIVQVLSRRKHDNTEQYQRSQAMQLIRKRKTEEAIQDWLRRMRAEAYVEYHLNK